MHEWMNERINLDYSRDCSRKFKSTSLQSDKNSEGVKGEFDPLNSLEQEVDF